MRVLAVLLGLAAAVKAKAQEEVAENPIRRIVRPGHLVHFGYIWCVGCV